MKIKSALSKEKYISALKRNMSAHSEFGIERFTGFFAGRFFYVTHHCSYKWHSRISSQKNAAFGYVKDSGNGCEVHFIRFRGMFCPFVFFPTFLAIFALCAVMIACTDIELLIFALPVSIACTLVAALIVTFLECTTNEGEKGRRLLLSMLRDPSDPRANLPYIP